MTTEKEMLVSEIIQEYGCCSFEELSDGLEAAEEKGCRNEYLATVFNGSFDFSTSSDWQWMHGGFNVEERNFSGNLPRLKPWAFCQNFVNVRQFAIICRSALPVV